MIAGPILPRTAEGLWNVVQDDASRIEHGMVLVRADLVLEGGLRIDALAADAAGRPVLVFLSMVESDHALPARIREARDWFARSALMLREVVAGFRLRLDLAPRVVVVGFEFTERCLGRLGLDGDVDLMVVRVDALRIAGRVHVGTVVVHGASQTEATWLSALPRGESHVKVSRFTDLLHRLDDHLSIDGDRFARTWRCDGVPIARLERAARDVLALVPGHGPIVLSSDEAVDQAVDLASRRYLGVLAGHGDADHGAAAVRAPAHVSSGGLPTSTESEVTPDEYEAFFTDDDADPSDGVGL